MNITEKEGTILRDLLAGKEVRYRDWNGRLNPTGPHWIIEGIKCYKQVGSLIKKGLLEEYKIGEGFETKKRLKLTDRGKEVAAGLSAPISIIWYKTQFNPYNDNWKFEELEVIKETKEKVVLSNGRTESKRDGNYTITCKTKEECFAAIIGYWKCEETVALARAMAARTRVEKIRESLESFKSNE